LEVSPVDLKGALMPYGGKHFAAITDPVKLGELLRAIEAYRGGPIVRAALKLAPMLFQRPGERSHEPPISDNSVRTALISMGYTAEIQTWHGFRATARTMLAERLEFDTNVIEAQLAHAVKDANGRAYNRTQYIEQRRRMMQAWADYLDKLRMGADVIVGQFGKAA
jgi:integrase